MTPNCIHGLDVGCCAYCQEKREVQDLEPELVRVGTQPYLILRRFENEPLKVMTLNECKPIQEIEQPEIVNPSVKSIREDFQDQFYDLALKKGFIFVPMRPLTTREQTEYGPTHSYKCKILLSLENGALGCTNCKCYVCLCGRCICGFPGGFNYLGQFIPPQPPLPCEREDRLEYLRVVRMLRRIRESTTS